MRSFPLASTLQMSLATWMDSLRPPAQECSSSSEPDDLSRDSARSPARSRVSSEEESRRFRNGGEPRVDHVVYVYVLVGLCDVPRNGHGTTPGHPRHRG